MPTKKSFTFTLKQYAPVIVLPPAIAMLVALLSRLWTLSVELLVVGGAFWIYWRKPSGSGE